MRISLFSRFLYLGGVLENNVFAHNILKPFSAGHIRIAIFLEHPWGIRILRIMIFALAKWSVLRTFMGPTIIVRIMEVFELWRFNCIISASKETENKNRINKESSNYRGSNYEDSTVASVTGFFICLLKNVFQEEVQKVYFLEQLDFARRELLYSKNTYFWQEKNNIC